MIYSLALFFLSPLQCLGSGSHVIIMYLLYVDCLVGITCLFTSATRDTIDFITGAIIDRINVIITTITFILAAVFILLLNQLQLPPPAPQSSLTDVYSWIDPRPHVFAALLNLDFYILDH